MACFLCLLKWQVNSFELLKLWVGQVKKWYDIKKSAPVNDNLNFNITRELSLLAIYYYVLIVLNVLSNVLMRLKVTLSRALVLS